MSGSLDPYSFLLALKNSEAYRKSDEKNKLIESLKAHPEKALELLRKSFETGKEDFRLAIELCLSAYTVHPEDCRIKLREPEGSEDA